MPKTPTFTKAAYIPRALHYPVLDGLRGVAAGAVAFGHLVRLFGSPWLAPNTALAVDFFFMLSGFVLDHAYGERLTSPGATHSYFLSRVVRLYPMILLGSMLGFVSSVGEYSLSPSTVKMVAFSILLIPMNTREMFPLNPPLWSLLFEMMASTLFGLGVWQRWRIARLAPTVTVCGIVVVAALVHKGSLDAGWALATFHYGLARVAFGFGCGVLLHRLCGHGLKIPSIPTLAIVAALLASLLIPSPPAVQCLILVALFPSLILMAARIDRQTTPTMRWSGAISYPLYVLHYPILILLVTWLPRPFAALAFGPFALAAAYMALRFYDEPVRALLKPLAEQHRLRRE